MKILLELFPVCYAISVVCSAIKEDSLAGIVRGSAKFFLQLYLGILSFGVALYLLCQWIQ